MDFQNMEYTELLTLKAQIEFEIKRRESEEKSKARKQILELAKTYGLELDEVLGKVATTTRKPVAAKYRHPADPSQTWTGRGRKPRWVEELLQSGKTLEDLAI